MIASEKSLREFGTYIQKLIDKQDLSRQTSYELFCQLLEDRQPDLQQGAFLAALTSKRETSLELAGAWQAIFDLDTVHVSQDLGTPLVENSGTGMDLLRTFNVSTAGGIVAAAAGVRMARHGSRALSSTCGTVDLLEALGVYVDCEIAGVEKSIRETNIGLFNGMSPKVHPRSLSRILGQIRFGSTLNIAASLASPCKPTHALRGVYSKDVIPEVVGLMHEIGFVRAMVVHGFDAACENGMDELSILGESIVCEVFENGDHHAYILTPEDVGLSRCSYEEIRSMQSLEQEAVRLVQVLAGSQHRACQDFTCLNAGAVMYLVGKTATISEGVSWARETIQNGSAIRKLVEWVGVQCDDPESGLDRLNRIAGLAGVTLE